MCTHVHVLIYSVLFYLYLLCSRKANFYVIHRQWRFRILYFVFCIKQATISVEVPYSLMARLTLVTLWILFWYFRPFRWLTIFGAHVLYGPHSPELNRWSVKTVQQGKEWTEGPACIIIANFSFSLHEKDINVQNNLDTSRG